MTLNWAGAATLFRWPATTTPHLQPAVHLSILSHISSTFLGWPHLDHPSCQSLPQSSGAPHSPCWMPLEPSLPHHLSWHSEESLHIAAFGLVVIYRRCPRATPDTAVRDCGQGLLVQEWAQLIHKLNLCRGHPSHGCYLLHKS